MKQAAMRRHRMVARFGLAMATVVALLCVLAGPAAAVGPFEVPTFGAPGYNADGTPSTEAGGRPFELQNVFSIETEQRTEGRNAPFPSGSLKDVEVELPPGIVGNAAAFPRCTQEEMDALPTDCPNKAQIGYVHLKLRWGGVGPKGWQVWARPVYNMVPPPGVAAQFAFRTLIATVHIDFHIRTGSDYGVTAVIHNSNATAPVLASDLKIWGLPADPGHDNQRIEEASINTGEQVVPYPEPPPFVGLLSNPTSCKVPLVTEMRASSWQNPDQFVSAAPEVAPKMTDCGALEFNPSVEAKPSTDRGDSPSGLDFNLHVPQSDSYAGERAANEVQAIRLQANRGQFKLTFNGQTTPDLPFNAGAGEVLGALEALGSVGAGNVAVTGGPGNKAGSSPYLVTFHNALGRQDVEQLVLEDGTEPLGIFSEAGLEPGIATVTTPTPGASGFAISGDQTAMLRESKVTLPPTLTVNPSSANGRGSCSVSQVGYLGQGPEKQTFTYERGVTESFTLSFRGSSTGRIPGEATQAQVLAALQGLPGLAGNVSVKGAPGGWTVTFGGALAGTDVPLLSGTTYFNPSQTLEVTGEEGGYTLGFEGAESGKKMNASFTAGEGFFFYEGANKEPEGGEPLLGPGIAPGTDLTFAAGWPEGVAATTLNTTAEENGVLLRTGIRADATAAQIQETLRMTIPALERNAFVQSLGVSGDTHTFRIVLGNAYSGTTPATLTADDGLAGPGAGVTVTPEAAAAPQPLDVVTTQEAGMPQFTPEAANCPDDSKLGTVRISSPAVIDHPLEGAIYLATPHENPFGTLLAMYITVDDPRTGVVVKLPARIDADPQTGQLTTTVAETPQLPFEDLSLSFFKGAGAPLKTGLVCGNSSVQTDMVPWTAPEGVTMHPGSSFTVSQACATSEAAAPNTRTFEAGTQDPVAGAFSPFTLKLSRPDGSQQLSGLEATLPKGLLAKLAGTPYCSDAALAAAAAKAGKAEQASPSCPAASRIGSVTVGAGAGPTPFYAQGAAYLAGPYKGAPLSVAVVTPAVAGPFDLGTVVVRNALRVDPLSAQVRVVSDPFPTILQGIPLDLRSIVVNLEKSQFTKNPTSCAASSIDGAAISTTGQSSPLSQHFQVGDCGLLGFKPKLALSFKGQTKRTGNPAVNAVLTQPEGQSGIAGVTVLLPKTEFIDQAHVKNPCTRVQFNADECPANSVLGTATAWSPLLEAPLTGPVYFRSNGGERKLPDIVADLNGQIHLTLVGFIDSVHVKGSESSRIRTRFLNVPDAPVSRFELALKGGKKGLIENSKDLCQTKPQANVLMDGQSGKSNEAAVAIKTTCGKSAKHKKKGKKGQGKKQTKSQGRGKKS